MSYGPLNFSYICILSGTSWGYSISVQFGLTNIACTVFQGWSQLFQPHYSIHPWILFSFLSDFIQAVHCLWDKIETTRVEWLWQPNSQMPGGVRNASIPFIGFEGYQQLPSASDFYCCHRTNNMPNIKHSFNKMYQQYLLYSIYLYLSELKLHIYSTIQFLARYYMP